MSKSGELKMIRYGRSIDAPINYHHRTGDLEDSGGSILDFYVHADSAEDVYFGERDEYAKSLFLKGFRAYLLKVFDEREREFLQRILIGKESPYRIGKSLGVEHFAFMQSIQRKAYKNVKPLKKLTKLTGWSGAEEFTATIYERLAQLQAGFTVNDVILQNQKILKERARYAEYCATHKEEFKAYYAAYRARHKEEIKARHAAYRATHKEEIKARHAAYRATHKEEIKARQTAYRATHKEEIKALHAAYRASHKEYFATYRATHKKEIKALKAAYRARHKEEYEAYQAAYRATHKEEIKALQAAYRATHKEESKARKAAYRARKKAEKKAAKLAAIEGGNI